VNGGDAEVSCKNVCLRLGRNIALIWVDTQRGILIPLRKHAPLLSTFIQSVSENSEKPRDERTVTAATSSSADCQYRRDAVAVVVVVVARRRRVLLAGS
jgi:hypothetical protein